MDAGETIVVDTDEYIKLKAQYDNAVVDLDNAKKQIDELKANEVKLNKFIANYVSSDKPAKDPSPEPLSFNELYNKTVSDLGRKD